MTQEVAVNPARPFNAYPLSCAQYCVYLEHITSIPDEFHTTG